MAKTTNPLVDVEFIDESNYTTATDTDDIVGVVVESDWGAPDKLTILDSPGWQAFFNPFGTAVGNYSQAVVSRAFSTGASFVEVLRLASKEKYMYLSFVKGADSVKIVQQEAGFDLVSADESSVIAGFSVEEEESMFGLLRYRYPRGFNGFVTLSEVNTTRTIQGLPAGAKVYSLSLYVNQSPDDVNPVASETYQVTFFRVSVDGESLYYADVINSKSQYFVCPEDFEATEEMSVTLGELGPFKFTAPAATGAYEESDYVKAYGRFMDREQSSATLLISTFDPALEDETYESTVKYTIASVVEKRMDTVGLVGGPKATLFKSADSATNKGAIEDYFETMTNAGMFINQLAASEKVKFLNKVYLLDGTALLAGRISAIAKLYNNRNRLPSYKTDGGVSATLTKSLEFSDVVDMMETSGIGSIYSSSTGNYIFNIRTAYPLQTKYFARLNVIRVTAAVLRWLLTDVEYVIHTDVVSDQTELLSFQDRCNAKLSEMIARGELKEQSVIVCSPEINTDALTNGGECLNIEAYLWFKKLAERVKIKIIATDTTTQVSLTQE